jgi:hypothetical protein
MSEDIVWGAESIRRELGLESRRSVYNMVEKGHLPEVRRIGRKLLASRARLRARVYGQG